MPLASPKNLMDMPVKYFSFKSVKLFFVVNLAELMESVSVEFFFVAVLGALPLSLNGPY